MQFQHTWTQIFQLSTLTGRSEKANNGTWLKKNKAGVGAEIWDIVQKGLACLSVSDTLSLMSVIMTGMCHIQEN